MSPSDQNAGRRLRWVPLEEIEILLSKQDVVSERAFRLIDEGVLDIIEMFVDESTSRQRNFRTIADLLEDAIGDTLSHTIDPNSVKVVCDERNNSATARLNYRVTLDIEYQQYNCVNRTKLRYTFRTHECVDLSSQT
jgi:hypothetical protein